jgi:hypothetical protein
MKTILQLSFYKLWESDPKNDDSIKIRLRTENLIYFNQWKSKLFIEKKIKFIGRDQIK